MRIKFSDIELAFYYVNSAPMTANVAVICKETGEIFYASDYDDVDEIPEEVYDRDDCIEIPHKNDLDLGRNLVFEFVEQYLPSDFERIKQIFRLYNSTWKENEPYLIFTRGEGDTLRYEDYVA